MAEVTDVAVDFGQMRRREWRRILALSVVGHAALVFALTWTPRYQTASLPGVVTVELVSLPASARRAKPRPRPPVPQKVVLPAQPTAPKPEPKPPEAAEKLVPPEPVKEPEEQSYTDVLAELRAAAGESKAEPEAEPAAAAAAPGTAGGSGRPVSPEVLAWMRQAKIHVRKAWVLPPAFRTQPLETQLLVKLDAEGNVIGEPQVVKRSGNPWYDEGVVRAIEKASPLPPPPAADEWAFVFVPGDSY